VIEYARNVVGLTEATSGEFDPETEQPVIIYMPEISKTELGGTMRLGVRRSRLSEKTLAMQIYDGQPTIMERHRHRYEVNPEYVQQLTEKGLVFSGVDDDEKIRMECVELKTEADHPFFFGCQYHPEFLSRPLHPSPPFLAFVQASAGKFVRKEVSSVALGKKALSGRASPSVNGATSSSSAAAVSSPTSSSTPAPSASEAKSNN
jgi:CTP synthase